MLATVRNIGDIITLLRYITAFDPTTYNEADDAVVALKITTEKSGVTMATVCNYGCHPTSLGQC